MIRLTELSRDGCVAVVRVEGDLTGEALTVLQDELQSYHESGVTDVRLEADGLQILSHHVATGVTSPVGMRACYVTTRPALYHRLVNYGLTAELIGVES